MNESPKGKYRMWQWGVCALIMFGLVYILNGLEWFTYTINSLATASAGLVVAYYGIRMFVHERTHELSEEQKYIRQNCYVVGIFILVGCSLIS